MKRVALFLAAVLAVAAVPAVRAAEDTDAVLTNDLVEWRWSLAPFATESITDLRRGVQVAGASADFGLVIAGVEVTSEQFTAAAPKVEDIDGGRRATFELTGPGGINATRTVEVYDGVAGFRAQTVLHPTGPLALTESVLQKAAVGSAAPTIHALRAGADWREPGWTGPDVQVGDPHAGTWRDTESAPTGTALAGPAQWISTGSLFMVMERNDLPSSRAAYDGTTASVRAEYARDVVGLGPFEENAHVENPAGTVGRARVIKPSPEGFSLEAVFVGVALDGDDEAWQFNKYLTRHRLTPYAKDVTFNSNGTDTNRISTGAKDDMDFATVQEVAPLAKRLGVDTFILDDGWQAISGDWEPDARRGFDADFANVRAAIAPMKLGLWMSPMHFHPTSKTYQQRPELVCAPAGNALAAYNTFDQTSGSNEAGIGEWSPAYIKPFLEPKLREAITEWGVTYFKFDFLAWLDCAGQGDMYDMREQFVAMLDRLRADHPDVTFQIDETNDYRLFPYESVTRGPSWFQNGSPGPSQLLHNLWNLSPYVPTWSLGQHVLGGRAWEKAPVDTLMATALLSHITYFSELRSIPSEVIDAAAPWLDFYKANKDLLTGGVVYPLLADPIDGGWTALQSWDPEAGRGALLAFRQNGSEDAVSVPLRNVRGDGAFDLLEAPSGAVVGTVTADELRAGLPIALPANGARVLLIVPRP